MGPQQPQIPPTVGAPDLHQPEIGGEVRDSSLSEALATLRKRRWVLVLAVALGAVYGTYKAFTQPRIYTAAGTIQVNNGESNEYKLDAEGDYGDSQTKMNTAVLILKSDTLLSTVAREMDLPNNPDFSGVQGPTHFSMDNPNVRANVLGALDSNLQVTLVPRTEILRIAYSSLNPKLAADIVNRVIGAYIQRGYQTPVEMVNQVSNWLSDQLDALKTKVERSQEQMMELQRQMGVLGYNSTQNQQSTSLEQLLDAADTAKVARIDAESRYNMIVNMDPNTIESSIETTPGTMPGELNSLRAQLAAAKTTYAQLTAPGGLGPNHPRVKAVQAQIDQLTTEINAEQDRLVLQAREHYLAAKAAEDKIDQELEAKKSEAYKQGDDLVRYSLVQREFEQDRTLYDGLEQRLSTARVQAGLDAAEVSPIDLAVPPVDPTMRPKSAIIVSTTIFFLLGGIVLAFVIDALDTSLQGVSEIEALMDLPSLAIIPKAKRTSVEQAPAVSTTQRNITVLAQPKSQFAEAFRSLRTSLLLATAGQPPKFILFTSAIPSEGKTTTACNLACVLAQRDVRVLLLDADLRRPNVHHRFGLTGKVGLTSLLAGSATIAEAVQKIPEVPNLDVLPSGPLPPFPTEMLSSDAMQGLLAKLGETYSHIVIDSPPVLSVTDGVVLAGLVDAAVLVIRHGKSNKHTLRRAHDLMTRASAPMAGLVLNAVDANSPEYYGYYHYSGYSYGSADSDSWETQPVAAGSAGPERKTKR